MDKELEAIAAIGLRRSRMRGIAFGIAWPVLFVVLFLLIGMVPGGIVSFFAAAATAQGVMVSRTPVITEKVCAEFGIAPEELQADKYLIT